MNIEIANRLVQLRKENNFSQEELAGRIGISRQAISKWERAEASPDTDNLINLARLYNVSLDELLKTDEEIMIFQPDEILQSNDYVEENNSDRGYTIIQPESSYKLNKKKLLMFPYPVFITILYLVIGFSSGFWHPAWILYLTIPIYYCLVSSLD